MIAALQRRARKSWHIIRRRLRASTERPNRLVINKAEWLNDARSPVMLGIDDLTNAWHNRGSGDRWEPGGDWGGGLWARGSALRFLEEGLLRDFPEVRVTFFTVAGPISPYTKHEPFRHAASLDASAESQRFFRSLAEDRRFELAYHGLNHGLPGIESNGFVQEWRGFPSVKAAVEQTKQGLDIFSRATGAIPIGGKYGGWEYNGFGDEAVNECGFLWWCRDWTPRDVTGQIPDGYYDPQFFGRDLVVGLPSTLHGFFWDRRQIDLLLDRRQPIVVTEHISPVRPDGRIQTPNIVDDMGELRRLFTYLRAKHVWHATGSEIASYVVARERSLIYGITHEEFSIRYEGRPVRPLLTLRIDCSAVCTPAQPIVEVTLPDGTVIGLTEKKFHRERYLHLVTIPVMEGRYRVRPRAA